MIKVLEVALKDSGPVNVQIETKVLCIYCTCADVDTDFVCQNKKIKLRSHDCPMCVSLAPACIL